MKILSLDVTMAIEVSLLLSEEKLSTTKEIVASVLEKVFVVYSFSLLEWSYV